MDYYLDWTKTTRVVMCNMLIKQKVENRISIDIYKLCMRSKNTRGLLLIQEYETVLQNSPQIPANFPNMPDLPLEVKLVFADHSLADSLNQKGMD